MSYPGSASWMGSIMHAWAWVVGFVTDPEVLKIVGSVSLGFVLKAWHDNHQSRKRQKSEEAANADRRRDAQRRVLSRVVVDLGRLSQWVGRCVALQNDTMSSDYNNNRNAELRDLESYHRNAVATELLLPELFGLESHTRLVEIYGAFDRGVRRLLSAQQMLDRHNGGGRERRDAATILQAAARSADQVLPTLVRELVK